MMESLLGGLGVSSGFDSTRRVVLKRASAFGFDGKGTLD